METCTDISEETNFLVLFSLTCPSAEGKWARNQRYFYWKCLFVDNLNGAEEEQGESEERE